MLINSPPAIQIARPNDYLQKRELMVGWLLGTMTGGGLKALLSLDFNVHDNRLRECLEAAIDEIERYTGRLLLPATATVTYTSLYNPERLPYGGTVSTVTATDLAGLVLTPATPVLDTLTGNYPYGIILTYAVGYTQDSLPHAIRESLLWNAANSFDYGDRNWRKKAMDYRLNTWAS